jgi:ubiquitin-conjugating enzyme (huntingtin interacting protein 2)
MPDEKRIMKELQECKNNSDTSGVEAWTLEGNLVKWRGKVQGPPDTPYAGGVFMIDIQLPDAYPFEPPKMKFITKVWHPNISSQTGAICLDILKNEWR